MADFDLTLAMDEKQRPAFRRALKKWYQRNARQLPWRETRDPYRIWISEIMLQQTTVVAVIPYYERFFKAFPNVVELAAADEQHVLKLWEGLGYYSRARNIHKSARKIVDEYAGQFPTSVEELLKLPGIGRYTAGAIASFAFDQPAPIVEANTLRLYCRLLGYADDPRTSQGQQVLWEFAEWILPKRNAGNINQALMELGSVICTPKTPACPKCPLKNHCQAFLTSQQEEIPVPKKRPEITPLVEVAWVVENRGKILLRRCQDGERWAGLWDLPRFDVTPLAENAGHGESLKVSALSAIKKRALHKLHVSTGLVVDQVGQLTEIRHSVTRYRIRLICFQAKCDERTKIDGQSWVWADKSQFGEYPLSTTGRQIVDLL